MKQYILLTFILCLIMVFSPLICSGIKNEGAKSTNRKENIKIESEETVKILNSVSSKVIETTAKDYVLGALAAEMPASYSDEALKAQAVAYYTYYRYIKENADNSELAIDYDISSSSSTHQGYLSDDEMKEKWKDKYDSYHTKLENIVLSVLGECIMYEGEPIYAAYHAISSGTTNSSKTVFGTALPYLKGVNAPGDKLSPDYDWEKVYTKSELIKKLNLKDNTEKISIKTKSDDNGFVTSITIENKDYTGLEAASALNLKSPTFSAEYKDEKYIFKGKGYGHGVGMSQYSADYMARQGSTYKEILSHFYPETYIDKIL